MSRDIPKAAPGKEVRILGVFQLKSFIATALIAAGVLGAMISSATAATFNISFTQTSPDLIGPGPDWFGTFEAPSAGGALSSFSATIDSVTYNVLYDSTVSGTDSFTPTYDFANNTLIGQTTGNALIFSEVFDGSSPVIILNGFSSFTVYGAFACSQIGSCLPENLLIAGTYEIAPVPLPAALPLLMSALGFFGFMGWRRNRKIAAA